MYFPGKVHVVVCPEDFSGLHYSGGLIETYNLN